MTNAGKRNAAPHGARKKAPEGAQQHGERSDRLRRVFLDYDAHRQPKTSRFCACCQRDLRRDRPVRAAFLDETTCDLIHPEEIPAGQDYWVLLGADCARRLGWEFTMPELQMRATQRLGPYRAPHDKDESRG